MKTELHLGVDNKIVVGGMDITKAVFSVKVETDALSIPVVTLTLHGEVAISTDGGKVILEYPHEVRKFFKGSAYEDPVKDVKEK